jgi:6-phosphofructokinase 1
VTRSVELINALRTPTGSHERVAVVELFGRNSGETALVAAFLADADRALISEVPFDAHRLSELVAADRAANPSSYAMVVVSEGASMAGGSIVESGPADAYGHRKLGGIGAAVAAELQARTGLDTLHQQLGYLMRAGAPDSLDRMVAISYGRLAVEELTRGDSGQMVAVSDGRYITVPADTPVKGTKRVDVEALYDAREYRPSVAHTLGTPMFLY